MHTAITLTEWIAAFLLAVEAIKLENLSAVRRWLQKTRHLMNPKITFVSKDGLPADNQVNYQMGTTAVAMLITFMVASAIVKKLGYNVGLFTLVVLWAFVSAHASSYLPVQIAAYIGVLLLLFWGAAMMGTAVYQLLVSAFNFSVIGLIKIQRNTVNGIVGMLGFGLFSLASILKLLTD
jgi:hypothetical protein